MEPESSFTRLSQEQQARQEQQTTPTQAGLEFRTAEELIRHDAAQTHPPERLEQRVKDSVHREAPSLRPWWRRWLGW